MQYVELFLNGKSLGTKRGVNCVFQWDNVTIDRKCEIRAIGEKDGREYKDQVNWKIASPPTTQSPQPAKKGLFCESLFRILAISQVKKRITNLHEFTRIFTNQTPELSNSCRFVWIRDDS